MLNRIWLLQGISFSRNLCREKLKLNIDFVKLKIILLFNIIKYINIFKKNVKYESFEKEIQLYYLFLI